MVLCDNEQSDFYSFSLRAEADLGMFSMFSRTGAPKKGAPTGNSELLDFEFSCCVAVL